MIGSVISYINPLDLTPPNAVHVNCEVINNSYCERSWMLCPGTNIPLYLSIDVWMWAFVKAPLYWCINTIIDIENNRHIHICVHTCKCLPRVCMYMCVCVQICAWFHTHIYQGNATEVFMQVLSLLLKYIARDAGDHHVMVATILSLAAPQAVMIFCWDIANAISNLENLRSRSWPK